MIKTTKESYPIETEINCFGEWNSMYDLNYNDDDERQFITEFANGKFNPSNYSMDQNNLFEVKDEDDFEKAIDGNCDQDLFEAYCEWLENKYPSHEFFLHIIPKEENDCFFVIEANEISRP